MAIIYVAGFVDVVNFPKIDSELYLDVTQINKFLPLKNPIPLNIEHLSNANIGWIMGLYQVEYGLFCVGIINSEKFLSLLEKLFPNSHVAQTRNVNLPPEPKLEMLHTWLPGLSLSSVHPDNMTDALGDQAFQHVSLCAMGRRRGTVAVYGLDLEWVLSKFTSITEIEKSRIYNEIQEINTNTLASPLFNINSETLMAKAIDASFIKNRIDILKTDRGVAEIQQPTYLKASATPQIYSFIEVERQTESETMNPIPSTIQTAHQTEDLISVPRATFMSMLQTNLDTVRQASVLNKQQIPTDQFTSHGNPYIHAANQHNFPYYPRLGPIVPEMAISGPPPS
uniref:Capsid maturation protease n=1 Tax=Tadarida gammaherpesvirus TaxID=2781867 RepID=A0A7U3NPP7_9GAMA|nr:capsid maturation protease [Tadarida gammaherpesvirus]